MADRCTRARRHATAGLGAAVQSVGPLEILALMEATRVTGVARNVLDYANLARSRAEGGAVLHAAALAGVDARVARTLRARKRDHGARFRALTG